MGPVLSVAPETSSIEGGDRFHLDTSHDRPWLVDECVQATHSQGWLVLDDDVLTAPGEAALCGGGG